MPTPLAECKLLQVSACFNEYKQARLIPDSASENRPAVQLLADFLGSPRAQVRLDAAAWYGRLPNRFQQLICLISSISNLYKAASPDAESFMPALRFLPPEIVRSTTVTLLRLLSKPGEAAISASFSLGRSPTYLQFVICLNIISKPTCCPMRSRFKTELASLGRSLSWGPCSRLV